jgi:hypothetical protein
MATQLLEQRHLAPSVSKTVDGVSSKFAWITYPDGTDGCRRRSSVAASVSISVPLWQLVAAAALGALIPTVLCCVYVTLIHLAFDGIPQMPSTCCCRCCDDVEVTPKLPDDYNEHQVSTANS